MMKHTSRDYYFASKERLNDFHKLRPDEKSVIFAVYCGGLAIECMLRAFITKHTDQFDGRHNLMSLFFESRITEKLSIKEKERVNILLQEASQYWRNSLRYDSISSLKRTLGHEIAYSKHKNPEKFLKKYFSNFFTITEKFIEIGDKAWTR